VLLNLAGNAVKFTDAGRVSLSLTSGEGSLVFTVSDTGRGIPPADLPRIFDEFYQVTESDGYKSAGTGLGLPVSKALVEMLGGTIDVDSTVGVGSTFIVTIPVG
jgi:signal transduction histidine kinase